MRETHGLGRATSKGDSVVAMGIAPAIFNVAWEQRPPTKRRRQSLWSRFATGATLTRTTIESGRDVQRPDLLTAARANPFHTNREPFCVGGRTEVMETIRHVLADWRDVGLDEPDVGQRFNEETFWETWLPLAHVDGTSEAMRALSWRAAGLIVERWGEESAGHAEETVISAAFGHATPPVGLIGATSRPCSTRSGKPSTESHEP